MKSVSFKNLVLLIIVMLWGRVRWCLSNCCNCRGAPYTLTLAVL